MALPKIHYPTFTLTIPYSEGRKVTFRPFLVKEEKILLMAKESGEQEDIYDAISQIINNCVVDDDFVVSEYPSFVLEYIFIQLRSKSVGNIIEATVTDAEDKKDHKIVVDLDKVTFPENAEYKLEQKFEIKDINKTEIKVKLPTAKNLIDAAKRAKLHPDVDLVIELLVDCVSEIWDAENVYVWNDNSIEEKIQFLDCIKGELYEAISDFFGKMPTLEYKVTYKNSKGNEREVVFQSVFDFFDF